MNTQADFDLSTDEVPDVIAPDLEGKREALEIVRSLGADRARLVLHESCESRKRSQRRQEQYQEKRSGNDVPLHQSVAFIYRVLGQQYVGHSYPGRLYKELSVQVAGG